MNFVSQIKVAVILSDGKSLYFGCNLHPALKRRNQGLVKGAGEELLFFLNYPAGIVDGPDEGLADAALRELSEESAGFFFTLNKHPFFESAVWDSSSAILVSKEDLVSLNESPIFISYFDPWKSAKMEIRFYFYLLVVPAISLDVLNKFCSAAQSLDSEQEKFVAFKEVLGYKKILASEFFNAIDFFKGVSDGDDEWFFSKKEEPGLVFDGAPFNKGYFAATKKLLEDSALRKKLFSLMNI